MVGIMEKVLDISSLFSNQVCRWSTFFRNCGVGGAFAPLDRRERGPVRPGCVRVSSLRRVRIRAHAAGVVGRCGGPPGGGGGAAALGGWSVGLSFSVFGMPSDNVSSLLAVRRTLAQLEDRVVARNVHIDRTRVALHAADAELASARSATSRLSDAEAAAQASAKESRLQALAHKTATELRAAENQRSRSHLASRESQFRAARLARAALSQKYASTLADAYSLAGTAAAAAPAAAP